MVQLLIDSGIGHVEFKLAELYLHSPLMPTEQGDGGGELKRIPGSKEDVFASALGLVDKRKLMKCLTLCLEELQVSGTFYNWLISQGLSESLAKMVLHGIAFGTLDTSASQGLANTRQYLTSVGRYGNGALLYGIYGTLPELCEAFARNCAVFGGITILRGFQTTSLDASNSGCDLIGSIDDVEEMQVQFQAKKVILGADSAHLLPSNTLPRVKETRVFGAVITTNRAIKETSPSLFIFPPPSGSNGSLIFVMQLDESTKSCSPGQFLLHVTTMGDPPQVEDVDRALESLRAYRQPDDEWKEERFEKTLKTFEEPLTSNDIITSQESSSRLDVEESVAEAKRLFDNLCPGLEFLPKVEQDTY